MFSPIFSKTITISVKQNVMSFGKATGQSDSFHVDESLMLFALFFV